MSIETKFISWIGNQIPSSLEKLDSEGYKFYKAVKYFQDEYWVGDAILVPNIEDDHSIKTNVARIHALYENIHVNSNGKRYRAVIEMFKFPRLLKNEVEDYNIFQEDIDIIQQNNLKLYNMPIIKIQKKCFVIFSSSESNPIEIIEKNRKICMPYPIYVCRYILENLNSKIILKCVKTGTKTSTINNSDDGVEKEIYELVKQNKLKTTEYKIEKSFNISDISIENQRVKIKLKDRKKQNESFNSKSLNNSNAETQVSLGDISVDVTKNSVDTQTDEIENKIDTKTSNKSSQTYENKLMSVECQTEKIFLDENCSQTSEKHKNWKVIVNQFHNYLNKQQSDSKMYLNKDLKMYNKDIANTTKLDKTVENVQKTNKGNKRLIGKLEYINSLKECIKKIENNQPFVKPRNISSKQNGDLQLSILTEMDLQIPVENQNSNNSQTTDSISYEIQEKLGLITPQKYFKRPNLEKLDEEPVPKSPRKNNLDKTYKSIKKSSRKLILDSETTPKKIKTLQKDKKHKLKPNISPIKRVVSVGNRKNEILLNNRFELARQKLNSQRSECLVYREKELNDIKNFISNKLLDKTGGCMYISGVPGTGKTTVIGHVIDNLKKDENFEFLSVNAMALTTPRQAYVEIVKQMTKTEMYWDNALYYMHNFFTQKNSSIYILLLDEVDKLWTRKQDVLYNLLDYSSNGKTPLIILAIANNMDLPEKNLDKKISSRIGFTRILFKPYKYDELLDILKTQLEEYNSLFQNNALQLVARKIAAVSGDVRKAFAICTRATEIAEETNMEKITVDIISKTFQDMSDVKIQGIKACSKIEKLVLQSIEKEVIRTRNDEVDFRSIVQTMEELCLLSSIPIPKVQILLKCCQKLYFLRLIILPENWQDVASRVLLNVNADDLHYALSEIKY